jgi:lipoate-protein ligase A
VEGQTLNNRGAARTRPPAEVLRGSAAAAVRGIEGDFALLDAGAASPLSRVWTCEDPAVVLGVSRDLDTEVDLAACDARSVAVVRRASGGGTVLVGPGTLQYAIAIGHEGREAPGIDAVKSACNRAVAAALAAGGVAGKTTSDASGDLRRDDRKVGGVALRRRRDATLLHGTLLVDADLELVAAVLRHPAREPEWRQRRSHRDFLANLGAFDAGRFADALTAAVTGEEFGAWRP